MSQKEVAAYRKRADALRDQGHSREVAEELAYGEQLLARLVIAVDQKERDMILGAVIVQLYALGRSTDKQHARYVKMLIGR